MSTAVLPVYRQRWRDRAACAGMDTSLFFPEPGGTGGGTAPQAKAVCAGCPVSAECAEYAYAFPEVHGVWGGLSERERRKPRSAPASPYRGVNRHRRLGKWVARVTVNGRRVWIGTFGTEEEAARAVREAERRPASPVPQPRKAAA